MKKQFWAGLFSSLLPVCALAAAPGDMDLSFNHLGYVSTVPLKAGTGFNGNGLIQQADGKLVAVGNTYNAKGMKQFALLRYNLDGTLDTTFNGTGMVITKISDLAVPVDDAKAVIQQSNGRLVVVGVTASGVNNDCALVRYNKDGSLDETFGEQGIVTMGFGTKDDTCLSIIQQADDKLVVAGETAGAGNDKADFALARFNTDGSLDSSFGSGGKVTTDFNGTVNNGRSVIQLADGKLLMAGYSDYNFALTRYNTDGSLDTTFDADGKLFVDIASDRDYAISVLQQADDQLVLAGYTNVNPGNKTNFAVVRLNQDGSFDPSFNSTGKLVLSVDSNNNAVAKVIQQTDGKLVLAGSTITITSSKHMALVRLNTDGSLDTGFGGDGKVTANIGTVSDEAVSVVQQADGKLTVAGTGNNGKFNYMMLARFHGEVDTDGDGVPDTEDAFPNDAAAAVDTDGDGDTDAWLPNNPSACTADAPVCDALFRDDDNDGDGVSNTVDNCPQVANPTQDDINGDGYGDACASDAPALHITRGIKAKVGAGAVVAFAGDFDEDGYGDYIVGYPTYDPVGKTDAGRAEIISGQTGGVLKFIEGNAAKDNMGFTVAGNADVDGDGHIDVVVGAPKADPNGLKDAGTVTVIYGPNDSKPRTVLSGTRAKALLGSAVALGDVNGLPDGDSSNPTADIIAGAPKDNDLVTDPLVPVIGAGSVTVFSGASGNAVLNTFYGFLPKSYAGTSVATGDVDDDGNTDIVYGAPNDDDDSDPDAIIKDTGSVAVYTIDGSQLMYEPGATAKAYLGKSVASADMDGDGAAEVLAGAPGDDVVDVLTGKAIRKDAGSVSLYSGGSGSILYYGSVAKAGLGNSVAFGDVDGDGLKDVIVGASKDNKPAKKPIKGAGSISIWSGDDFGLITKVYGSASKEALGTTVAAGEVNGDGYDDVMVGVTGADTPAVAPAKPVKDTGAVQVLSGAAL
ncbi:MAG: FG-GAP repeat protein [Cellvibrionales bacterium]|nr:FG-GAP repeat protein [Cellvibrionales bacterium]